MAVEKRRSERLAGVWVVHLVEGVWAAALQRHVGGGPTDQHGVAAAALDLRTRSQRSHQCSRPPAQRSPAHGATDGQRGGAAHGARACRQPAALQRQAVGGRGPGRAAARAQRVLLEPRGTRRLSSQTLLDLRLSRPFSLGRLGRIELLLDVLNALNDTAEESLATETQMTETLFSPTFGSRSASSIRAAR